LILMLVVVEDMENGEYNVFLMEVNLVHYCELIIGNSVIAPRCKQVDESSGRFHDVTSCQ
jgi:hypothetical protein